MVYTRQMVDSRSILCGLHRPPALHSTCCPRSNPRVIIGLVIFQKLKVYLYKLFLTFFAFDPILSYFIVIRLQYKFINPVFISLDVGNAFMVRLLRITVKVHQAQLYLHYLSTLISYSVIRLFLNKIQSPTSYSTKLNRWMLQNLQKIQFHLSNKVCRPSFWCRPQGRLIFKNYKKNRGFICFWPRPNGPTVLFYLGLVPLDTFEDK